MFSPRLCAALRAVSALQLRLQGAPVVPFFQHVHLRPTLVELHYRAERVDVAALRDGRVSELVNLVPWEGVALGLKGFRMAGLQVGRDGREGRGEGWGRLLGEGRGMPLKPDGGERSSAFTRRIR